MRRRVMCTLLRLDGGLRPIARRWFSVDCHVHQAHGWQPPHAFSKPQVRQRTTRGQPRLDTLVASKFSLASTKLPVQSHGAPLIPPPPGVLCFPAHPCSGASAGADPTRYGAARWFPAGGGDGSGAAVRAGRGHLGGGGEAWVGDTGPAGGAAAGCVRAPPRRHAPPRGPQPHGAGSALRAPPAAGATPPRSPRAP